MSSRRVYGGGVHLRICNTQGLSDRDSTLDPRSEGSKLLGPDPRAHALEDALIKAKVGGSLFGERTKPPKIERYWLLERIGVGGMGEVYGAYDPDLDRKVALKLVNPARVDADNEARLYREAHGLARLSHPNVVQVYGVGRSEQQVYIVMEFVRGVTLQAWLDGPEQPRTWREILRVFIEAGRGLAAAHGAGLVHRDFKPSNILIGDHDRVRVIDFGLASPEALGPKSEDATRRNLLTSGTPPYMSPEQFTSGDIGHRSDQWSFCVALYEALLGSRPFKGKDIPSLRAAITQGAVPVPPRGAVPEGVWRVLKRGLSVDPNHRYPNMDALLAALEGTLGPRHRLRLGIIATAGASLFAIVAVVGLSEEPEAPCARAGAEIQAVWGPPSQNRAQNAIKATGLSYAASTWQTARRSIRAGMVPNPGQHLRSDPHSRRTNRRPLCPSIPLSRSPSRARAGTHRNPRLGHGGQCGGGRRSHRRPARPGPLRGQ